MKISNLFAWCFTGLVILAFSASISKAYDSYSQGKVINPAGQMESYGNCKTCHGGFRDPDYSSLVDGGIWATIYTEATETEPVLELGLHNIHRHIMLDKLSRSRCDVCHLDRQTVGKYPVLLNYSVTTEFENISCMGCHGRNEDDAAQNFPPLGGRGAGLRQHHTNAGVKECMTCHADANPESYTPVGENVLPPYYFLPHAEFPNKPTDPGNPHGEEDYTGSRRGLDNDGDGLYDKRDPDNLPIGQGNNNGITK